MVGFTSVLPTLQLQAGAYQESTILMKLNNQHGYMDAQFGPALIGAVMMLLLASMVTDPEFNLEKDLLRFSIFLLLATAALLYGFAMHVHCLGYPESPFNKHTSPPVMTLICAGPLAFAAYRFYRAAMLPASIVYAALAVLVVAAAIVFAVRRNKNSQTHA